MAYAEKRPAVYPTSPGLLIVRQYYIVKSISTESCVRIFYEFEFGLNLELDLHFEFVLELHFEFELVLEIHFEF